MRLDTRMAAIAHSGIRLAVNAVPTIPAEHRDKVALYLLTTGCNVPGAIAADVYGCSKQYASKALRQVEDLRDDDRFNAALEDLERQLGVL